MNTSGKDAVLEENSINLANIIWYTLKQWKTVLIVMAVLAFLLGGYKGYSTYKQYAKQEKPSSSSSSSEDASKGKNAITAQPVSITVAVNETAEFSIKTSGEVERYLWQYSKDGLAWSGLNTNTYPSAATEKLSFTALATQNNYLFRCTVTFSDEQVISSKGATLTISSTGKLTKGSIVKSAVKYAVIGGILGMILGLFFYAMKYIFKGYFSNGSDVECRYGINSFGVYPSRKNVGLTRKIMDKMTCRPDITQQESAKLIAAKMNLALPAGEKVYLTGTIDDKRLESIGKVLRPYVRADLKLLDCVNLSADAVAALEARYPVVCVERVLASKRTDVDLQMNTIARSGAECKGFVLIE